MADEPNDDVDGEPEGEARESHRERTIRMRAISHLALTLVKLIPSQLARMELPEDLAVAVAECQRFTKNARARQLRRIGGILRSLDTVPIEAALRELETGRGERSKREQSYEQTRTRLLEGGDPAMTAYVAANPGADVQSLRQLVRNATRDPASPRGKGASRDLLRMIRQLGEAGNSQAVTDEPPPQDE